MASTESAYIYNYEELLISIKARGVDKVLPKYEKFINSFKKMSSKEKDAYRKEAFKRQKELLEKSQPMSRIGRRRAKEQGGL